MRLHWHRRDLRLADNLAFAEVEESTVGLFIFDPVVLEHAAPPRMAFLLDALESLQESYHERDGTLLLAQGNPVALIPRLAASLDISTVSWGADYSGLARERDGAIRDALQDNGVEVVVVHDAVHHKPGAITTNDGDPYKVFTYFSKKWHDRPKRDTVAVPDAASLDPVQSDLELTGVFDEARNESEYHSNGNQLDDNAQMLDALPTLPDLDIDQPAASIPPATTAAAREQLESFCDDAIFQYADQRDVPAADATSRLSPHLRFGTIGVREVYAATVTAEANAVDEAQRESVFEFQDQLAWREFYTQVLWDRPDVVTQNYKSYEKPIEWRHDPTEIQAWKDGKTGYPIVDAGMRQLREEAWMHNRVRMIVASFLTKDLLADWRVGYDWFCEKLVDHETANDNGGWQWAAATGTDAQPYFRIFNPMSQAERHDPEAVYIKRYIPELDSVPADIIHEWHELDAEVRQSHAPEYPAPIVDHAERREEAIAMFERARGDG